LCYICFGERLDDERRQREQETMYLCDICRIHPAITGRNGYGVCSEECDRIAVARPSRVKGVVHETRND
jgi:hypothetical protein